MGSGKKKKITEKREMTSHAPRKKSALMTTLGTTKQTAAATSILTTSSTAMMTVTKSDFLELAKSQIN